MSDELCTSKPNFLSLLISSIILFFSFPFAHPLYFAYFIFFSPYLLKLASFLSPLFITTILLSLSFLTVLVHNTESESPQSKTTNLLITYTERLRSEKEQQNEAELQCLEDLGMYETLFGSSPMMEEREEIPLEFLEEKSEEDPPKVASESSSPLFVGSESDHDKDPTFAETEFLAVNKVVINQEHDDDSNCAAVEEKKISNFLKILDEFERMASSGGVEADQKKKKVDPPTMGTKFDKVVEKEPKLAVKNGSEAIVNNTNCDTNVGVLNSSDGTGKECTISSDLDSNNEDESREHPFKIESSRELDQNNNLWNYGSMRKEKEWKRTLACKLFEERHNVDGGDGMDSLWEAYEMDSDTKSKKNDEKIRKKMKKKKSVIEEYEEDDEDKEINGGQLCCLQAIKLSTGKMNLGMGRPNLVKISKAIKGIGWLHHVTKHSKKVHNNGDRY